MDIINTLSSTFRVFLGNSLGKLLGELGEEVKHTINNNILEYQVEEAKRNYYTKTLLHRINPVELSKFYQPLFVREYNIFEEAAIGNRISTESTRNLFSKLKNSKCLTIIGSAGSGKSTLIKYLFIDSIKSNFKIPIKIELRYLNEFNGSLLEYINNMVFKLQKLGTHDRIIERLLGSGDFIFFLDGYDEVSSSKKAIVTKEIDDMVKVYNKNYYLLSSRPYTEIELLPLFVNYLVCDLSESEISEFIEKQIEERELSSRMIEAIGLKANKSYKSFLSNPLLLSMFILTFQSYSNIPQKRSQFYSQVFDTLYSTHDSMSKMAFVREKESGLSRDQFVEILKLFSFLSFFEEKFIFSKIYIEEKFSAIKTKKQKLHFDNDILLKDLQIAISILTKEGTDYVFPHRSLQEYFAATYIAFLEESNKKTIYTKILNSLSKESSTKLTARENFYSLLAELDERSAIEFLIIPYLKKSLTLIHELDEKDDKEEAQGCFNRLKAFFDCFYVILKYNQFIQQNNKQITKYSAYKKIERKNWRGGTDEKKIANICKKKLVKVDIIPFFKKQEFEIEQLLNTFSEYLDREREIDEEFISLI